MITQSAADEPTNINTEGRESIETILNIFERRRGTRVEIRKN